jgi:hypothetical protein
MGMAGHIKKAGTKTTTKITSEMACLEESWKRHLKKHFRKPETTCRPSIPSGKLT